MRRDARTQQQERPLIQDHLAGVSDDITGHALPLLLSLTASQLPR